VLSAIGLGLTPFGLFICDGAATGVSDFDPYNLDEVIEYIDYLERFPEDYDEKLETLDSEQQEAIGDAYTVSYIITDNSATANGENQNVDIVNQSVGKKGGGDLSLKASMRP
jgi:hypothetical protein